MKQALVLVNEIKRKKYAMLTSKSAYLKNDYSKSIRNDMRELKTYCKYKHLDFDELCELIK